MAEKQKDKFVVISRKDIIDYFTWPEAVELSTLLKKIQRRRKEDGKAINSYIVCNQDEPYAEEVWQLILKGESANEKKDKNKIKTKVNKARDSKSS